MILYDKFVKLVSNKEYGKIKRAWFTTFVISPDFIERYILPPLLGLDNDLPKTPSQFESINAALSNKEIDIRFFYDAKMPIEGFKRTTVNFQGVFNDSGLFHPKVSLIEFEKCSFLIVGSANLTISGWGRNREAITIKEIGGRQANQVKGFFDQFSICKKRPRATKEVKTWDLIYKKLPKKLICDNKCLYVWSPYFSSELESLCKNEFPDYKVKIIPDRVNGKIRLKEIPTNDDLSFYDDGHSGKEIMTHAKVWLTDKKICIGSHNFTSAALKDNNMEASIIDDVDKDTFRELTNKLKVINSIKGMTEEELKEDSLPENYNKVIAHVEANWKNRTINLYFIIGEERKLNDCLPWKLYLPGNVKYKQKENIHGNCTTHFIKLSVDDQEKCFNALLTDRMFYMESSSEIIATGYIEERDAGSLYRSPHKYSKLHDFFLDSLSDVNPKNSGRTRLLGDVNDEHNPDDKKVELRSFGYFEIFQIFIKIKERILCIKDKTMFTHAVSYAPNSVKELKKLLENEIEQSSFKPSIYNWFIIYEFNSLLEQLKIEEVLVSPIKDRKNKLSSKDKRFIKSVLNLKKGVI